jgi:hypothetical protein
MNTGRSIKVAGVDCVLVGIGNGDNSLWIACPWEARTNVANSLSQAFLRGPIKAIRTVGVYPCKVQGQPSYHMAKIGIEFA